jgi:hypothetical protein
MPDIRDCVPNEKLALRSKAAGGFFFVGSSVQRPGET